MGLTAFVLMGCLVGCSNSTGSQETSKGEETTEAAGASQKVGLIMPTLSNEFLAATADNIKAGLEEQGLSVDVASSDDDPAKQLQLLENFANMGTNIIVIMPMGSSAAEIGSTLQSLSDRGIRIVSFGNKVDIGCCEAQILADFENLGCETAMAAAEWIDKTFPDAEDGSIEVALVTTTTSVESKTQSDALRKVEEYCSKAKIVESYEKAFTDPITKVQEHMDMMLATHPEVKAVLTYDSQEALAVDEVIMRSNQIDKANFGVFASGLEQEIGNRIAASEQNESVFRYTNYYTGEDGTSYGSIVQAVKGELSLDDEGMCTHWEEMRRPPDLPESKWSQ